MYKDEAKSSFVETVNIPLEKYNQLLVFEKQVKEGGFVVIRTTFGRTYKSEYIFYPKGDEIVDKIKNALSDSEMKCAEYQKRISEMAEQMSMPPIEIKKPWYKKLFS